MYVGKKDIHLTQNGVVVALLVWTFGSIANKEKKSQNRTTASYKVL